MIHSSGYCLKHITFTKCSQSQQAFKPWPLPVPLTFNCSLTSCRGKCQNWNYTDQTVNVHFIAMAPKLHNPRRGGSAWAGASEKPSWIEVEDLINLGLGG